MEKIATEIKEALEVEFRKAIEESNKEPFESEKLDYEHKLIWSSKANAFSETVQWINQKYG